VTRHGGTENARNEQSARPASVSGLVDGLVTTAAAQDGSVSVQLVIGTPDRGGKESPHIEFVLDRKHAAILGETLLGVLRPRASPADRGGPAVPCCIGICLNSSLSDW
jgi:hypothetical protein